jgi:hypothetical protein
LRDIEVVEDVATTELDHPQPAPNDFMGNFEQNELFLQVPGELQCKLPYCAHSHALEEFLDSNEQRTIAACSAAAPKFNLHTNTSPAA